MGKNLSFADTTRTRQAVAATATGTSVVNGTWLALAACAGIVATGSIGTANAGNNVAVQFSADGTNPLGSAVGTTVSPGNGKSFQIVVHEIPPGAKFARVVVTRAGTTTTVDPWTLTEYEVANIPTSSTVASEFTQTVVTRPVL